MFFLTLLSLLLFSVVLLVGGIVGYIKVRSKASLISGLITSFLLLGTFVPMYSNTKQGLQVAMALLIAYLALFGFRWNKTKKFMPMGLLVVLDIICLVLVVLACKLV
jgi:uncharacterized membrane protein (UPF0136 family)